MTKHKKDIFWVVLVGVLGTVIGTLRGYDRGAQDVIEHIQIEAAKQGVVVLVHEPHEKGN